MKRITQDELAELLKAVKGSEFLTITALTDARLLKTNNPYPDALKLAEVNGLTGFDYEANVQRQQEREGDYPTFQAAPHQWADKNIANVLVELDGKLYLRFRPQKMLGDRQFFVRRKGKLIPIREELVKPFIPKKKEGTAQPTVKKIIYRDYALSSILSVTLNKEHYEIIG